MRCEIALKLVRMVVTMSWTSFDAADSRGAGRPTPSGGALGTADGGMGGGGAVGIEPGPEGPDAYPLPPYCGDGADRPG